MELTVDDSTELLYATLESDEDIPADTLNDILGDAVAAQVRQLYNNREEFKEQLAQRGEAIEAAKDDDGE